MNSLFDRLGQLWGGEKDPEPTTGSAARELHFIRKGLLPFVLVAGFTLTSCVPRSQETPQDKAVREGVEYLPSVPGMVLDSLPIPRYQGPGNTPKPQQTQPSVAGSSATQPDKSQVPIKSSSLCKDGREPTTFGCPN